MNEAVIALTLAIGGNVAVWAAIFWRMRAIERGIVESFLAQGEQFLAGPSRRRLVFARGWATNKNIVVVALSQQRLLSVPPLGKPLNLSIDRLRHGELVQSASSGKWVYRREMEDGREMTLELGRDDRWRAAFGNIGVPIVDARNADGSGPALRQ